MFNVQRSSVQLSLSRIMSPRLSPTLTAAGTTGPCQTVNLTVRACASHSLTELTCALLLCTSEIHVNPRGGGIHMFFLSIYTRLVSLNYNTSMTRLEIMRT